MSPVPTPRPPSRSSTRSAGCSSASAPVSAPAHRAPPPAPFPVPQGRSPLPQGRPRRPLPSPQIPLRDRPVRVNPPVPQKRPVPPRVLDLLRVTLGDQYGGRCTGLHNQLAEWITHKRMTKKLQAVRPRLSFEPHTIHGGNVHAVRNRMRSLRRAPRVSLHDTPLLLLLWVPTDRRRVQQDLSPHQTRDPRGLRIPLVPANQHADRRETRAKYPKARCRTRFIVLINLARREIVLLVIQRVVRNVHLAIHTQQRAVGVDHGCGVVVQPGAALLEYRHQDHNA